MTANMWRMNYHKSTTLSSEAQNAQNQFKGTRGVNQVDLR